MKNKHIGRSVMSLADLDNIPANVSCSQLDMNISSSLTRIYKYEGKGIETLFTIFIDAKVNKKSFPYVFVNSKCGVTTIGKTDGMLKSIYENINKDVDGDFSNIVKIIKPGNFLWYNLVNANIHREKSDVDIYFDKGHVNGQIIGHTKGSRNIGNQSSVPFMLIIKEKNDNIHRIPINVIDVVVFRNKPEFEVSQKGVIASVTTELLAKGHICRGDPLAGYILDACYSKKRLIYFDHNKAIFFTIPELEQCQHDDEIKEISHSIHLDITTYKNKLDCNKIGGENK